VPSGLTGGLFWTRCQPASTTNGQGNRVASRERDRGEVDPLSGKRAAINAAFAHGPRGTSDRARVAQDLASRSVLNGAAADRLAFRNTPVGYHDHRSHEVDISLGIGEGENVPIGSITGYSF
jgi:hypothetical protein